MSSLGGLRTTMIAAAIAIAVLGGLGIWLLSDGSDETEEPEREKAAETPDPPAPLPPRWTHARNAAAGFTISVPPGWSARREDARTTLRSPRSSVVVAITADRSDAALDEDLDEFASAIVERLEPGAEVGPLRPLPRSSDPDYVTAGARATDAPAAGPGSGASGAKRLEVIVVRREGLAAYPLLIVSDATVKPADLHPITSKLVRSLRGRPVG